MVIMYIIIFFIIIIIINILCKTVYEKFNSELNNIPFVIICWNNLTFVKNFVNQIKKYKRKIIILNNNSEYELLYKYFIDIKNELGDLIEIRTLDKNYGHIVYRTLYNTLPDVYILSDPDLELNKNLPDNFVEILYELSNKYKKYKIGSALNISDKDQFISCQNYTLGNDIYQWESQFWNNKIENEDYELYNANIDTTLCLINNKYYTGNNFDAIRIAGNFTVKHLPWYKNYIKDNIPSDELEIWRKNNISSSILSCIDN
jgi:hypothetical protein